MIETFSNPELFKNANPKLNGWTGFTWEKKYFPDYKEFLQWTNEKNLQTCLNLHPAAGVQWHEDAYPAFAKAMNFDTSKHAAIPFDITNKNFAKNYFDVLLHPYEKAGVDFWWLDWQQWAGTVSTIYTQTLSPAARGLMSHFRLIDMALKAVGVGSVGSRCAVSVLVGDHPNDVLVLQGKQAEPSVLARYLNTTTPAHQGQRVVEGQRLMQTASDGFLGWSTNPNGDHIYLRHFRDWKGSVDVSQLDADGVGDYGRLCGWTLAKAHARSGDRAAICTAMGSSKTFAASVLEQAVGHADQAQLDYQALLTRIASGEISTSAEY